MVPSLTSNRMAAAPNWLVNGVRDTVRAAPLPPSRMLAVGNKLGLSETAWTVKAAAEVCASPIVNANGPAVVFSGVLLSAIAEIVGGELAFVPTGVMRM